MAPRWLLTRSAAIAAVVLASVVGLAFWLAPHGRSRSWAQVGLLVAFWAAFSGLQAYLFSSRRLAACGVPSLLHTFVWDGPVIVGLYLGAICRAAIGVTLLAAMLSALVVVAANVSALADRR